MSHSWGPGVQQKGSSISWQVQDLWESQLTLLREAVKLSHSLWV